MLNIYDSKSQTSDIVFLIRQSYICNSFDAILGNWIIFKDCFVLTARVYAYIYIYIVWYYVYIMY